MKIAADTAGILFLTELYGGKGTLTLHEFMGKEDLGGAGRRMGIMTIPQHASIGPHTHTGEFESYYIMQGSGLYLDNDREYVLTRGDFVLCKDGDTHGISNPNPEDLVMYIVILNTIA